MPSSRLRPPKNKTITTRRSPESIYSKLRFDFNDAQVDPESFKQGFYAHNMGRPDVPQHTRRLLRGLNRHTETQDKIAAAKDVGELLGPKFKEAVKGMTRKQQQRRYKRWEKVPVSNFTARMNALKKIHEASIDHVTPELYKDAAKVNRILRNAPKGKGHIRSGRDSVKVERLPNPPGVFGTARNRIVRAVLKKTGINPSEYEWSDQAPEGVAYVAGRDIPRAKRGKHFNLGGTVAVQPRKFKDNASTVTHELLHIKDPGKMDSHDVPYLKRRQERHAFGGSSIVGVRGLKKLGVSQELAATALGVGSMRAAPHYKLVTEPSANALGRTIRKNIHRKTLNFHNNNLDVVDNYLGGRAGKRPQQKMAKEVWKGIERVYGARNKTGGTVNKFGHVKLATPIKRLPESREELIASILEAYDDHKVSINKYGQVNFTQIDRGKPGDYTFWEKHKAQNKPVVRPKEAPARPKLHRAKVAQPKPSTARDRALAWQRKHAALGEASIDHFTPNLYKTARRMERAVRTKKWDSAERYHLKHNFAVPVRKFKMKNKEIPVSLQVGGTEGIAATITNYTPTSREHVSRYDTIHLNPGHLPEKYKMSWQGRLKDRGVFYPGAKRTTGVIVHELGHATDPASEFDPWKGREKASKRYYNTPGAQVGKETLSPGETHSRALEGMYGIHRGKLAGISREDMLHSLRRGGEELNARHFGLVRANKLGLAGDSPEAEHAWGGARSFNVFTAERIRDNKEVLKRQPHSKVAKRAHHKLAKEALKGIERKYGPVRTRIKGNLPEGLLEQVLISVDSRVEGA